MFNSKDAATYLKISESKLRMSRYTGKLDTSDAPPFVKKGRTVYYQQAVLDSWLESQKIKEGRKTYLIWNNEGTEAFATTDHSLALAVQNGDWEGCGNNLLAKAFCDHYSENQLTNHEIKVCI